MLKVFYFNLFPLFLAVSSQKMEKFDKSNLCYKNMDVLKLKIQGCDLLLVNCVLYIACVPASSKEQLRCDTSWAVWDLGKEAWWRVFHITELPWEIPTWEGMHLYYRRWDLILFCFLASLQYHFPLLLLLTSPSLNLLACCSLSSGVHRPVLWWEVFHRALLGV